VDRGPNHPAAIERLGNIPGLERQYGLTIRNSSTYRPHPRRKAPCNAKPIIEFTYKREGLGPNEQGKSGIRVTRHEQRTGQRCQRNSQRKNKLSR
jgi:hypothetical protein